MRRLAILSLGVLAGCQRTPPDAEASPSTAQQEPGVSPALAPAPEVPHNWDRDLLFTRLDVEVPTERARATIRVGAGDAPGLSLEARDLEVETVEIDGVPTPFSVDDRGLHVAAPAGACELVVDYRFHEQPRLEGFKDGLTLTWPYNCGHLFPCDSRPDDGIRFELSVQAPEGERAIYPERVDAEAPSYMLAWVSGPYEERVLGTTSRGRKVSIWSDAEHMAATAAATEHLPALFDWLEATYGEYTFGDHVGSVVVDWGPGGLGGMEHHPFWHVSQSDTDDVSVHVHEAAHGWYGNGVRIACWEDFVLSEGTVTYMATRAIESVLGNKAGREQWKEHEDAVAQLRAAERPKIAWPAGCNEIDILKDGLFGPAPYVEGALFYRQVAARIGVEQLDAILRDFYLAYRGRAARFEDMLAAIEAASGWDPHACALAWLRSESAPAPEACAG